MNNDPTVTLRLEEVPLSRTKSRWRSYNEPLDPQWDKATFMYYDYEPKGSDKSVKEAIPPTSADTVAPYWRYHNEPVKKKLSSFAYHRYNDDCGQMSGVIAPMKGAAITATFTGCPVMRPEQQAACVTKSCIWDDVSEATKSALLLFIQIIRREDKITSEHAFIRLIRSYPVLATKLQRPLELPVQFHEEGVLAECFSTLDLENDTIAPEQLTTARILMGRFHAFRARQQRLHIEMGNI